MTVENAKLAAKWRVPVTCHDVRYARISALSIRYSSEYEIERRKFPAERADKRFREKHPILFNSIVAFIASLICNIILDWLMSI